jgi:excisionase family DNA binding protein
MAPEKLYTPEEAAGVLGVSPKTIRGWLRTGKLTALKVGRLWRVRERDLQAFLEEGEMPHKLYKDIVDAVRSGTLTEPFTSSDVRRACPGWSSNTYGTFLPKHRVDNPGGNSELFEQLPTGQYKLLRPIKYGFPQV